MASASQAIISTAASARGFPFNTHRRQWEKRQRPSPNFSIRVSSDDSDCNVEECAPDKEVGKVSMEWLAGEKTKVVGTYPPRRKGWTGYVEKDTAGQENIYSVEPAVYVAESAISSGSAGSSADGSENTAAIAAGLALIFVAGASSILLQVGKDPPKTRTIEYSGPSLSYYINKFKPPEIIQAAAPIQSENSLTSQPGSSAPRVSEALSFPEPSTPLLSTSPSVAERALLHQLECTTEGNLFKIAQRLDPSKPIVNRSRA
ncbi:hypothetical protein Nepgr_032354 [Nepenthes gracilis]|uniref:Uncharacterized protein n=1 Tax=Nepenthes gracilis TaxID=150966 RepID=A0AAD3Y882_NEPGR|nr:hypothetical protein Nepgr_032354 [Nepenthes gracilis]